MLMITLHVHTQTLIIIITISTTCAWEQEQGGNDLWMKSTNYSEQHIL